MGRSRAIRVRIRILIPLLFHHGSMMITFASDEASNTPEFGPNQIRNIPFQVTILLESATNPSHRVGPKIVVVEMPGLSHHVSEQDYCCLRHVCFCLFVVCLRVGRVLDCDGKVCIIQHVCMDVGAFDVLVDDMGIFFHARLLHHQ